MGVALLFFEDGPAHLHSANVWREYDLPERGAFREYDKLKPNPEPNWTGQLLLAGFMILTLVMAAEKIVLTRHPRRSGSGGRGGSSASSTANRYNRAR